jgi:hypothetical protein
VDLAHWSWFTAPASLEPLGRLRHQSPQGAEESRRRCQVCATGDIGTVLTDAMGNTILISFTAAAVAPGRVDLGDAPRRRPAEPALRRPATLPARVRPLPGGDTRARAAGGQGRLPPLRVMRDPKVGPAPDGRGKSYAEPLVVSRRTLIPRCEAEGRASKIIEKAPGPPSCVLRGRRCATAPSA